MRTVYVVGMPACGKSTALAGATELLGWKVEGQYSLPVPHVLYDNGAAQIGRLRETMSGTDALSMSIGPKAIEWVFHQPTHLLVGEGDRLAYDGFLDACAAAGSLDLVYLDINPHVARKRALARNPRGQNLTWVRGRISKVENLLAHRRHHWINAAADPLNVAAHLASIIAR